MIQYRIDFKKLAICIREKRADKNLREIAQIITSNFAEISPSTISRLEHERFNDIATATFLIICSWLEMSPTEFIVDLDQKPKLQPELNLASKIELLLSDSSLPLYPTNILSAAIRAGIEVIEDAEVVG